MFANIILGSLAVFVIFAFAYWLSNQVDAGDDYEEIIEEETITTVTEIREEKREK